MFGSPYSACGPADGFGQKEKPDTLLSKLCMMSSSDLSDHGEDSDAEEAMQLSSLLCDETGYEVCANLQKFSHRMLLIR